MESQKKEICADEKMTLTVKSSTRKETLEVLIDTTISNFKEMIANKFDVDMQSLRLIYAGRILKDVDTIKSLGIKNGSTIYAVIKTSPQTSIPTTNSSTLPTNRTRPSPLVTNFMQSLCSNSDFLQLILNNDSALQEVVQRNPELGHVINNPTLLREAMEIVGNPNVADEFMRSADRAINNIESLPGGFNALQQMYHDLEEPLMDATSDTSNPFAGLLAAASSNQQGTENREPLPNPWSPNQLLQDETDAEILSNPLILNILEQFQNYISQSQNRSPQMPQDSQSLPANPETIRSEDNNVQQQLNEVISHILSQNLRQSSENTNNTLSEANDSILPALLAGAMRSPPTIAPINDETNSSNVSELLSRVNIQNISNTAEQVEEHYGPQLHQLTEMGFGNQQANLQALIACSGDLNQAIEMLLTRNLAG